MQERKLIPAMAMAFLYSLMLSIGMSIQSHADALNSQIDKILAEEGLVGMGWATVTPEEGIQTGTSGFSDKTNEKIILPDTRFHVGSIAKAILATGILRLASENKIDLNRPAQDYLPDLSFNNPWQKTAKVTVRHLLDHTSGLHDAQLWQVFGDQATPDVPLVEAFPNSEKLLRIRTRPGTRFSYSNSGYTLLGMIIEHVTGERYEAWLDANLLAPLSLKESTFEFTRQEGAGADTSLSWGHNDDGSKFLASPIFLRPAGQFTTTTSDLARLAVFMMSDGTIDGKTFIRSDLMMARGKPVGTEASNAGLIAGYALGLGRRDRHGVVGLCHSGNIVGFSSLLCLFPEMQTAIVYSVNTDSETADYSRLAEVLIRSLKLPLELEPETDEPQHNVQKWEGYYVLAPNRFEGLAYVDTVFGFARARWRADEMLLEPFQGASKHLRPTGRNSFSSHDRATISHALLTSDTGRRLISDGFRTYGQINPAFLAALWFSLILGLAGLLWIFAAGTISLLSSGGSAWQQPHMIAFAGIPGLFIPIPLFFLQPFMAFPDMTIASVLLAVSSLLLVSALIVALVKMAGSKMRSRTSGLHYAAIMSALQWLLVLAYWGLMPIRMWAI